MGRLWTGRLFEEGVTLSVHTNDVHHPTRQALEKR
jgi:hypothetical protein